MGNDDWLHLSSPAIFFAERFMTMSDVENNEPVSSVETNGHKEQDEPSPQKTVDVTKIKSTESPEASNPAVENLSPSHVQNDIKKDEANVVASEDQDKGKGSKEDGEKIEVSDEESEDEREEEELQPGLLERPVILEEGSKRQRKKTERMESTSSPATSKSFEIVDGKGTKLGDLPNVEFHINRTLATDLKLLHRLAFGKQGSLQEVKRNLRKFSGYPFDKESGEYNRRLQMLKSQTIKGLKGLCLTLDIERGGTKEVLMDRLIAYLMEPVSSGKALPKSKRKRSKGSTKKEGSKGRGRPKKTPAKKVSSPKKAAKSKKEVEESDDDDDDEETESSDSDVEEDESEEEEAPPKKKAKKSSPARATPTKKKEVTVVKKKTTPKASPKKVPEKKTPVKKSPVKKAAKRPAPVSDSSDDSDDEPLQKKPSQPPTDDELREEIKKILDGANLEEITMKTVCKQVYDKYPDHDLVQRKDFIKSTVKQIIR